MEISQQRSYIQQYIGNSTDKDLIQRIYGLIEANREKAEKDTKVRETMTARALRAEKDVEEGRVYTRKEVEKRIKDRLGL